MSGHYNGRKVCIGDECVSLCAFLFSSPHVFVTLEGELHWFPSSRLTGVGVFCATAQRGNSPSEHAEGLWVCPRVNTWNVLVHCSNYFIEARRTLQCVCSPGDALSLFSEVKAHADAPVRPDDLPMKLLLFSFCVNNIFSQKNTHTQ